MIADTLHKVAMMEDSENGGQHAYYPRPSMAGPERCIRQMVYHGLNFPHAPLPGRTIHVFNDSSWHEELTGDWLGKSPFRLHSIGMKVDIEFNGMKMRGAIDGIITDIIGIDRHYEHKAINHFSFQRYWNGELPLDNISQSCLYIHGLQDVVPDIHETLLLMKNKNTAAYLEFLLSYDREADTVTILSRTNSQGEVIMMGDQIENIVGGAFDKFKRVDEYIEKKTLPKRQYEPDSWRCEYCSWFQTCYENYQAEFDELKTDSVFPSEFVDTVKYYKELGGQASDIKKERDGIAETIKNLMKEADAREGRAGEYVCKLTLSTRQNVDKSKIPVKILEEATTTSMSHQLTISQPKSGKK